MLFKSAVTKNTEESFHNQQIKKKVVEDSVQKFQCLNMKLWLAPALKKNSVTCLTWNCFWLKAVAACWETVPVRIDCKIKDTAVLTMCGNTFWEESCLKIFVTLFWVSMSCNCSAASHLPSQLRTKLPGTSQFWTFTASLRCSFSRAYTLQNTLWLQKLLQTDKQIAKRCATNTSNMMPTQLRTHLQGASGKVLVRVQDIISSKGNM